MPFVITDPCIETKDTACVDVCPVDCIIVDPNPDPTPDDWWEYPLSADDPYRS